MHRDRRRAPRHGTILLAAALVPSVEGRPEARASAGPLPPGAARTVEFARRGAMDRLRSPECRRVLTDFADGQGRPLTDRLAVFALPPDEYLARVALLDGSGLRLCREGDAELVSVPGAARILVCPRFLRTVWQRRTTAEVYLIHEMLHTLGLGEDPPTSRQITGQVARRCAP